MVWEIFRSIPLLFLVWIRLRILEIRERIMTKKKEVRIKMENKQSPFEMEGDKGPTQDLNLGTEGKKTSGPSGTISRGSDDVLINPRVAGQLLNLPFRFAHAACPAAAPLTEEELEAMAEPFADFLVDMGWEKIGRSSYVLFVQLAMAGYTRYRAVMDYKREKLNAGKNKIAADPGNREAGPGKDDSGKIFNPPGC
jgi:hypothetical protein